jgi:hypothetical protein
MALSLAQERTPLMPHKKVPCHHDASSPKLVCDMTVDEEEALEPLKGIEIEKDPRAEIPRKKRKSILESIDATAFQFALRMAVLLTLSALFVLIRTSTWHYPDGMWVLVSVLFVCWFPSLDAASVIEKIIQRLIGTFVGATLGLGCGFFSIWAFHGNLQAIFLTICTFAFNFGIIFLAGQIRVGNMQVIQRFAYATILCVLTFCICMLPFGTEASPKWELGVWRVINVIVGCLLGAAGSIAVCPRSTTQVLHDKTARQVKLAGEASEALLTTASDFFAGRVEVNRLADEILEAPLESAIRWKLVRSNSNLSDSSTVMADIALKKYEDAIMAWRATKALFPLMNYDPFALPFNESNERAKTVQKEIARTLARALRIQTTIVVLDGMIRNDAEYDFDEDQLYLFSESGSLIRTMLSVPLQLKQSNAAAKQLFLKLEETRQSIRRLSSAVNSVEEDSDPMREMGLREFRENLLLNDRDDIFRSIREEDDEMGRGVPKDATSRNDNTLFFLQLVEHLILRSLRLYQAWKHAETLPQHY